MVIAFSIYKLFRSDQVIKDKATAPEPPFIPSTIPFIGHAIGLFRHGTRYYSKLSAQYQLPIYSLSMPGTTFYIVNSLDLVQAVQKLSKTLSFRTMSVKFAIRLAGVSKATAEMLSAEDDEGSNPILERAHVMQTVLQPGESLDRMNRTMIEDISHSVDELSNHDDEVDLLEWTRQAITVATTGTLYGPSNPYRDPELRTAFWYVQLFNDYPNACSLSKGLLEGYHKAYFWAPAERHSSQKLRCS